MSGNDLRLFRDFVEQDRTEPRRSVIRDACDPSKIFMADIAPDEQGWQRVYDEVTVLLEEAKKSVAPLAGPGDSRLSGMQKS